MADACHTPSVIRSGRWLRIKRSVGWQAGALTAQSATSASLAGVLVLGCALGGAEKNRCRDEADCLRGFRCVDGLCTASSKRDMFPAAEAGIRDANHSIDAADGPPDQSIDQATPCAIGVDPAEACIGQQVTLSWDTEGSACTLTCDREDLDCEGGGCIPQSVPCRSSHAIEVGLGCTLDVQGPAGARRCSGQGRVRPPTVTCSVLVDRQRLCEGESATFTLRGGGQCRYRLRRPNGTFSNWVDTDCQRSLTYSNPFGQTGQFYYELEASDACGAVSCKSPPVSFARPQCQLTHDEAAAAGNQLQWYGTSENGAVSCRMFCADPTAALPPVSEWSPAPCQGSSDDGLAAGAAPRSRECYFHVDDGCRPLACRLLFPEAP